MYHCVHVGSLVEVSEVKGHECMLCSTHDGNEEFSKVLCLVYLDV